MKLERPFVFWLLLGQLLVVVPAIALAAALIRHLVDRYEADALASLRQRTSVAADALAREADRVKARLQLLASHEAALAGDVEAIRNQAMRMMALDPAIAGASAYDASGQLVFTTHRPPGTPLPKIPLPPGAKPVFERGETFVSGLTLGGLNDVIVIGFATPWRVNGQVKYSLRMAIKPSSLSAILRAQRWPDDWIAVLMDHELKTVARTREEEKYFNQPVSASLQSFIRTHGTGVGVSTTLEGEEVVVSVAQVPGTPWRIAAGLPRQALHDATAKPIDQLAIGAIGVTLLGAAGAVFIGRRLTREVRSIAAGRSSRESSISEFRAMDVQRLMLDNELVGMVRLKDRRAVWHNRAFELIFQYSAEELVNHSPRLMHIDDAAFEQFGAEAYQELRQGKPFRKQIQMVRKDGGRIWADVSGIELAPGETLWMILDVTLMKHEQQRAEARAMTDALTGLPNREALLQALLAALDAARHAGQAVVVCFVDLNGFKAVNDTHGHHVGDELLKVVATRLADCLRPHDTVARLGGDEFVLLITQLRVATEGADVLRRVAERVGEPVRVDGVVCSVSAAIGWSSYPGDGTSDAEALLALADARMYEAKRQTKRPT